MYRLAKPSTFQNTPAIYHHLKSWDDIQNGRHWSSFCEIRWIFYIQKYLTNHGLSVNENYANEQPSILYILEYLYIILTCRRHPLSSPEKSGGTRLSPVRPAIPRPFEGTSASDLDRTFKTLPIIRISYHGSIEGLANFLRLAIQKLWNIA